MQIDSTFVESKIIIFTDMTRVINIDKSHEPILSFLYPTYSVTENPSVTSKFIIHRDIKTKSEREALDVYYDDCIFISTQIFDEFWDIEKLKSLAVKFAHENFKSRRRSVNVSNETLTEDLLNFIFELTTPEQEAQIYELFDSFGSQRFPIKFMELTKTYPYQVLNSSMNTFISKILHETNNIYYTKKALLYKKLIIKNLPTSLSELLLTDEDPYGFKYIKFYMNLCQA